MWHDWTRAEAEAVFARWTSTQDARRDALTDLAARTGGPVLDRSVDSLPALNRWLLERSRDALHDATPGRPEWVWTESTRIPDSLWRLADLAATYVADVLQALVAEARWVCFRTADRRDDRNGMPMLDLGWPENPVDVFAVSNGRTAATVIADHPFEENAIRDAVLVVLDQLAAHRAGTTPRWAPG